MKNTVLPIFAIIALMMSLPACKNNKDAAKESAEESVIEVVDSTQTQEVKLNAMGFEDEGLRVVNGTIESGQFFSTLLNDLGVGAGQAYAISEAALPVFDVTKIRVGNTYSAYIAADSTVRYFVYDKDRMNSVVFDCQSPYKTWVYTRPITLVERYADVTINTSMWNDMRAADVSPLLIVNLSDIYAWTIDFFGLQKGDRFRVLYQEKRCDGEVVAVDTIRYAVFSHNKNHFSAIRFDQGDNGNIWWNEKGESMKRAFLKAPLKYSRISSGFSYNRLHPITRKVRPHTGVDYAAPMGTPVMSIGDGVVTSAKYEGAGGNTIRIKHNSTYSTAYLHLSKYATGIKAGKRVKQGEVIGYVGSTGRSTGPHLDFRIWKNGTPIDPLKMDSPSAEPILEKNRAAFEKAVQSYQAMIESVNVDEQALEMFKLL